MSSKAATSSITLDDHPAITNGKTLGNFITQQTHGKTTIIIHGDALLHKIGGYWGRSIEMNKISVNMVMTTTTSNKPEVVLAFRTCDSESQFKICLLLSYRNDVHNTKSIEQDILRSDAVQTGGCNGLNLVPILLGHKNKSTDTPQSRESLDARTIVAGMTLHVSSTGNGIYKTPSRGWQQVFEYLSSNQGRYSRPHSTAVDQQHVRKELYREAFVICGTLSADGVLSLLHKRRREGWSLPDLMHMPSGYPLLIAFACRTATFPELVGLPGASGADNYLNHELAAVVDDAFSVIDEEGCLAVDALLKQAVDRSAKILSDNTDGSETPEESFSRRAATLLNNGWFWQSVGQDVICRQVAEVTRSTTNSELMSNPLHEVRVQVAMQNGIQNGTIPETPLRIPTLNAPRTARLSELIEALKSVEQWLRTGTYEGVQISKQNRPGDKFHFCRDAYETALDVCSLALMHGPSIAIHFGVKCHVFAGNVPNESLSQILQC